MQRATPRPVLSPAVTASGGKTLGVALGSTPASQTGAITVRSDSAAGGGKRMGMSTQTGVLLGAAASTVDARWNLDVRLSAALPKSWPSGLSLMIWQSLSDPRRRARPLDVQWAAA